MLRLLRCSLQDSFLSSITSRYFTDSAATNLVLSKMGPSIVLTLYLRVKTTSSVFSEFTDKPVCTIALSLSMHFAWTLETVQENVLVPAEPSQHSPAQRSLFHSAHQAAHLLDTIRMVTAPSLRQPLSTHPLTFCYSQQGHGPSLKHAPDLFNEFLWSCATLFHTLLYMGCC